MPKIRVLIADDHAVLRSGLKVLLQTQAGIEVVGEAADGHEAINKTAELRPDVLLLDITMPGLGGLEALKTIKETVPATVILVLTMHEDEGYLLQALKMGASGYIPKKAADNELINAIRMVHRGEVFIYPSLTRVLVEEMFHGGAGEKQIVAAEHLRLSQREREVLTLVAQGYTNQQIADRLYLSVKTVETYKARVMEKLNLQSRVELVRYALQHGLLSKDGLTST
ncbi:MAG: DNA-binding response regulator [candidate division Zixibacteria bacterium RBG_16_53_22]|nr:MAG: DNA-binding response regulator [candidate division Zixibacteria bacterium RBG_16_53_22]